VSSIQSAFLESRRESRRGSNIRGTWSESQPTHPSSYDRYRQRKLSSRPDLAWYFWLRDRRHGSRPRVALAYFRSAHHRV